MSTENIEEALLVSTRISEEILQTLKKVESSLERQEVQNQLILTSLENTHISLQEISTTNQINTWQYSVKNGPVEISTEVVIKILREVMDRDPNLARHLSPSTVEKIQKIRQESPQESSKPAEK